MDFYLPRNQLNLFIFLSVCLCWNALDVWMNLQEGQYCLETGRADMILDVIRIPVQLWSQIQKFSHIYTTMLV